MIFEILFLILMVVFVVEFVVPAVFTVAIVLLLIHLIFLVIKRLRRREGVKRRIVSGGGDMVFAVVSRTPATYSNRGVTNPAA